MTKKITWILLGATSIVMVSEVAIVQKVSYSIFSGFVLGIWLGWTAASLLKWD